MEIYVTEELARRFLLGDLDDSERQRIERLIIVDSEVKQTILIAEEELIEEYLDSELSHSDNEKFVARYANTSPLRRKLEIAEAIRRRASAPSLAPSTTTPVERLPNFLLSLWRRRRPLLIPATALAVVLIFAAIWFIDWNNRRLQERNRRNFIEQQLAQLNSPSELGSNPPGMLTVFLSPVSQRSASAPAEVPAGSNSPNVELQLSWFYAVDYDTYHAVIRRVSSGERYTVPNLHLHKTADDRVIKLRLRADFLTRGQYQIILSSFAKDGSAGPIEEYTFVAGR